MEFGVVWGVGTRPLSIDRRLVALSGPAKVVHVKYFDCGVLIHGSLL